jgi:aspartyl-tRNA(Asn)/glutamyl-tRNA(Gln) amidotransferase subunit C
MEGCALSLSEDQVRHVARLARLRLESSDIGRVTRELGSVLDYVAKLNQLDTENVEPTMHVIPVVMPVRDDNIQPSLSVSLALQNAPDARDHMFAVPRIMDGGES